MTNPLTRIREEQAAAGELFRSGLSRGDEETDLRCGLRRWMSDLVMEEAMLMERSEES